VLFFISPPEGKIPVLAKALPVLVGSARSLPGSAFPLDFVTDSLLAWPRRAIFSAALRRTRIVLKSDLWEFLTIRKDPDGTHAVRIGVSKGTVQT
jgi:hypothetical protein